MKNQNRQYKYYSLLKISRNATKEEIQKAFLALARVYHPDISTNPQADKLFKEINQAYQVLSNAEARLEYDNSPTECPVCWTTDIIQTAGSTWRCSRCGYAFQPENPDNIIAAVEKAAIPERWKELLRLFNSTQ